MLGAFRRPWLVSAIAALFVRAAVVAWAAGRFPPAADGRYYHQLATRLAAGDGYTWSWPDGAVTPAAHYPVGFPLLLALGYVVVGAWPVWGMVLGALFGALGAGAASALTMPWGRRASLASGLIVALHPALVPYAPALMTEAISGSLLLAAAALAMGRTKTTWLPLAGAGLVLGVATLIRPQLVVLAPLLGFFATAGATFSRRMLGALVVSVAALAPVLPWTARNCRAMSSCALVSVNGGWNLLIGVQTETGAWQEIRVPEPCKTVWDEAGKDACFGRAARDAIAADPIAALERVPAKLGVTFDYFGGAPWYLHESNAEAFGARAKVVLGAVDAISSRAILLAALIAIAKIAFARYGRASGSTRPWLSLVLLAIALVSGVSRHAASAYIALVVLVVVAGPWTKKEALVPFSAAVVATIALTHAAFFGAGRYGLVAAPLVAALAGLLVANKTPECQDDAVGAVQAIAGLGNVPKREESPSTKERDAG